METCIQSLVTSVWFHVLVLVLVAWEMTWKLLAMWKAAQKREVVWFILLAIVNTVALLPIIYLIINRSSKDKK